ncbi:hypothetical protein V5O48_003047 [Marasmius crinis-equi]|uniref:Uncharacterized protein n=1 Tax=Marasmius crinis-equi TaxID=585013 RepID=A0ABR3FUZ9_9AGAR
MAKVAIITGASSGIGRHTAIALIREGWNVVIAARRSDDLQETKDMMKLDEPRRCLVLAGDVSEESFVKTVFEETIKAFGHAQVPIEEISLEDFDRVLKVNLVAPFLCTKEAMRIFKAQSPPGGRIINNGSLSAKAPRPFFYGYNASKYGMTGLTKTTALEGRPYNIACTQINIGERLNFFSPSLCSLERKGNTASVESRRPFFDAMLQPDGRTIPEQVMELEHIVESVMHVTHSDALHWERVMNRKLVRHHVVFIWAMRKATLSWRAGLQGLGSMIGNREYIE